MSLLSLCPWSCWLARAPPAIHVATISALNQSCHNDYRAWEAFCIVVISVNTLSHTGQQCRGELNVAACGVSVRRRK